MRKTIAVGMGLGACLAFTASAGATTGHVGYTSHQLARARQEVRIAKADGTLRLLDRQVMQRHASAADTTGQPGPSAAQQALAVALYQEGQAGTASEGPPNVAAPPSPSPAPVFSTQFVAHAASGCHGQEWSKWWHAIAGGAIVSRVEKTNYGWCWSNTNHLTSGTYNFDHHIWAQYPYCMMDESERQGPDGNSGQWAHGGAWATTGIYSIAIVCVPILGGEHAVLRVAGGGYWDENDDYGF